MLAVAVGALVLGFVAGVFVSRDRERLLRTHHEAEVQSMERRFDETMARTMAEMKSATQEMLAQRQKEFAEANKGSLGQIVTPLRETIDKMQQTMADNTLKQTSMSSSMKVSLEAMMRQSEAAQRSTEELARLFKHGSKVQGDWGETVLTELLHSQGLTPGVHYDTQQSLRDEKGNTVRTEAGSTLRPDVILHLDEQRELIIDSKVSLSAFMDYVNAENEEDRRRALKAHVDSIRKHVKELAEKDYTSYVRPPKVRMDYVIMFVPHTGALWAAIGAQPDLWRKSMEHGVFIADEQTLFAALRIVTLTWRQIQQAQNHEEVYRLASEIVDRVGQFCKRYDAVGKSLQQAQKSYEEAGRKLAESGTQSIVVSARKLIKMGASQSEKNPVPELPENVLED